MNTIIYVNENPPLVANQPAGVDGTATISVVVNPNASNADAPNSTFIFSAQENGPISQVFVTPPTNGGYVATGTSSSSDTVALPPGAVIGPSSMFAQSGNGTLSKTNNNDSSFNDYPFPNDSKQFAYLGVEFQDPSLGDGTYYGWISVSAQTDAIATVNGWAFNNTPNSCIGAGQTSGTCADATAPEPSSLALFALGAAGLAAVRARRKAARA
jgi:hypothetical protein